MTIEQLLGYFGAIVAICGIVATVLPQQWPLAKWLTKIGALTFRAATKVPPAAVILLAVGLQGCAAWVPTATTPCAGLYCLEWDGTSAGLPADVLICAKTEQEALEAAKPLLDTYPKSMVRKVSK